MKRLLFSIFLLSFFFRPHAVFALTQPPPFQETYAKGQVVDILDEGEKTINGNKQFFQTLSVIILDGSEKNKTVYIDYGTLTTITKDQSVSIGQQIVVSKNKTADGKDLYEVADVYRLDSLLYIVIGFFVLTILVAGRKGIGSVFGLVVSFLVIMFFVVPQILQGRDPLLVSIIGSLFMMVTTIYLAHGVSKKITIAVVATFISLVMTGVLSVIFVHFASLYGQGNEDAYALQFGAGNINLQGLLLGGIIIGALGVLDDTTTTQATAIFELADTDKTLGFGKLVQRGFSIGREHVASLVNTLVLAYAGASLALFILFVTNPTHQPYWVILNSQVISEEIVRTLSGSIGLVLAVPLTTILASYFAANHPTTRKSS